MLRKHVNNTDVAIEIVKIFYVREKRLFKLTVRWWNIRRCHAPYPLNIAQKLEIDVLKWKDWEPYEWPGKSGTTASLAQDLSVPGQSRFKIVFECTAE